MKRGRKGRIILGILLAVIICSSVVYAASEEKHLVIKVVEEEDMVEIDDYDVPLSSFSADAGHQNAFRMYFIPAAVMLLIMIIYVVRRRSQSRKEQRLYALIHAYDADTDRSQEGRVKL